jgi:hypothetical protein
VGPGLAVVDFDAVCHGIGKRRDWIGCRDKLPAIRSGGVNAGGALVERALV